MSAGRPGDMRDRRDNQQLSPEEACEQLKLSDEELVVLRECRTNSLYLRGFPLGMLSAIATRYLGHNFFPHIRNWAGFYYTGAFTMGVVLGVASYKDKCFEKIMSLDNSRLADQMRNYKKQYSPDENMTESESQGGSRPVRQRAAFGARPPSFQPGRNSDHRQGSTNDEQESLDNEEDKGSKRMSYEELRRRHRDRQYQGPRRMPAASEQQANQDYSAKDQDAYDPDSSYDKRETYSAGSPWDPDTPKSSNDESEPRTSTQRPQSSPREYAKRNKYGDEME
ncbi:uncharacterized protein LOC135685892 [Rhopilema esculentum]|uniref:uncharacterized protein LOC135685892 n=1 Tax=Rhopilema esculentum TaxID=499914 RepID=UPI0031D9D0A8